MVTSHAVKDEHQQNDCSASKTDDHFPHQTFAQPTYADTSDAIHSSVPASNEHLPQEGASSADVISDAKMLVLPMQVRRCFYLSVL